ncbi:MAG: hypothetical protein V3U92_01350 [Cellulophaga sp.]
MKRLLIILIVICLTGCGNGSFFETKATYKAAASNLKVDLTAKGHVLDGDDLTDGLVTGIVTSLYFSDTIYFQANTTAFISLKYKKEKITNPSSCTTSVEYCLDKIGYSDYIKKELVVLGEVILATAYGPKGTYFDGQPDLIKVINVGSETNSGYSKENE